jgi:REP element-mobilizing transposase RayT
MPDHVHLVVRLAASVSQSELMGQVKGATSHLVNHQIAPGSFFRWQGGYGSFSFSHGQLKRVIAYVENQEEHHRGGKTHEVLEPTDDD